MASTRCDGAGFLTDPAFVFLGSPRPRHLPQQHDSTTAFLAIHTDVYSAHPCRQIMPPIVGSIPVKQMVAGGKSVIAQVTNLQTEQVHDTRPNIGAERGGIRFEPLKVLCRF